jgi:uncharacterized membrane-anchored protein
MMRKPSLYILIGLLVLQLCVPGYLVFRHYDTLRTGEPYKFSVRPYDPYDPFRGRYVALQSEEWTYYTYAVLERDAQGFATISQSSSYEKPQSGVYAKGLQLNRYYMNEKMAPIAERIQRSLMDDDHMYLIVMVKNGHNVIEGLYLNDISIEQHISSGNRN